MIRTTVRSLVRAGARPGSGAVLNVSGLALGLATFFLVLLYGQREWSYERFHVHAEDTYRLVGEYTSPEGTRRFARVPPAAAPLLKAALPEVADAVRLQRWSGVVRVGASSWREEAAFFAEPSFLDVFSFSLHSGTAETALSQPNAVVLTRTAAQTYLGSEEAVGRAIRVDDMELTVTAVVDDPPATTHLQFRVLISFETLRARQPQNELDTLWRNGTYYSFVKLYPGVDPAGLTARIRNAVDAAIGSSQFDETRTDIGLHPLLDIRLRSDLRQELGPAGSQRNLVAFVSIGFLVLLISCINFVNLSTAVAAGRAAEVGLRKSLGATRGQLVTQFTAETVLTALLATVLAVILATAGLPLLESLTGQDIPPRAVTAPWFVVTALGIGLVAGAVAGLYPAVVLSSFRPSAALARTSSAPGQVRLRQALVVVQFSASLFLLGGTMVALMQTQYLRGYDLGIDTEQIAVIPFQWDRGVQERYPVLRERLSELGAVASVTASGDVPGRIFTAMAVWGEGLPEDQTVGMNALVVDPHFSETYGIEVLAGRDFSSEHPTDWTEGFLLNESAARAFGWTPAEAVGKSLRMNNAGRVVGVLEDFHYAGVQTSVEPMTFAMWPDWFGYVSLRLAAGRMDTAAEEIEAVWAEVIGDRPFELFFLDDDFDRLYQAERRFGSLIGTLAVIAILIGCLGLYGLATFATSRRRKEIGVRRVLGAGAGGLALRLARGPIMLLAVSALIAVPLTWVVMERWLSGFAARIDMPWEALAGAVLITVPISLCTVLFQTLRAALADPVRSLRQE